MLSYEGVSKVVVLVVLENLSSSSLKNKLEENSGNRITYSEWDKSGSFIRPVRISTF